MQVIMKIFHNSLFISSLNNSRDPKQNITNNLNCKCNFVLNYYMRTAASQLIIRFELLSSGVQMARQHEQLQKVV